MKKSMKKMCANLLVVAILMTILATFPMGGMVASAVGPDDVKATGTIFGTEPSSSNVFQNAFDGDTGKAFGGKPGGYCGMDLGEDAKPLTAVRIYPRDNFQERIQYTMIQGANGVASIDENGLLDDSQLTWETIYTIPEAYSGWKEFDAGVDFEAPSAYRYIRVISADGVYPSYGEVEFYVSGLQEGQTPTPTAVPTPSPTPGPTRDPSGAQPVIEETFNTLPYFNGKNGTATVENNMLTMVKDKAGSNFNLIIWSDTVDKDYDSTFTVTFEAEVSGGYLGNRWDGYAVALRKNSGSNTELIRMVPSEYGTIITKGANGDALETISEGWHSYAVVFNKKSDTYSMFVDSICFVQNGALGWNDDDQHGFYIQSGHNDATGSTLHMKDFCVYDVALYGDVSPTAEPTPAATMDPDAPPTPEPTQMPTDHEFKLSGQIFGSRATSTNYYWYAMDGDTSTVFGGETSGYVGIDLGDFKAAVTRIRLYPRSNNGDMTARHIGAVIEGTNGVASVRPDGSLDDSNLTHWETIYTITAPPSHNAWTEYTLDQFQLLRKYRYIRYRSASSQNASVAEIEFYSDPTISIPETYDKTGTPFGDDSSYLNVFDGASATGMIGGSYVGMDFGADTSVVTSVSYYPVPGLESELVGGRIQVGKGDGTVNADGTLSGDIAWTTVYEISQEPDGNAWITVPYTAFTSLKGYRYMRFLSASGKCPAMAELIFTVDPTILIQPEFEVDKGKLLYTVGVMSDTHIDGGIEQWDPPIRQDVLDTVGTIRSEENAGLMILTGDITSCHCGANYTQERFNNVRQTMRQAMNSATQSGRTLYVTGNHEYSTGATDYNSGDYSFIMEEDVGAFTHSLYKTYNGVTYLSAYHYSIDGIEFIGINTPYSGGENHGNYVIDDDAISFVENVLAEIGQEKLVICACHYPFQDSRGISAPGKGMSTSMNNRLKAVLNAHPNTVYVYGHDHGGMYIMNDTFERTTPYTATGAVIGNKAEAPEGMVSSFAGSMAYYNSTIKYNGKTYSGIFTDSCPLAQALIIYVYDNCVELQMKNYGVMNGGSQVLASYPFPKSFDILGMVYGADAAAGKLSGIASGTTAGELKAVASVGGFTDVQVLGKDGALVSDNTPVTSDMTLVRTGSLGEITYALSDAPAPGASAIFRRGDVNGDNVIDAKDVTLLRRNIVAGMLDGTLYPEMDVNGDGAVNAKDVTILRRYIVGNATIAPSPADIGDVIGGDGADTAATFGQYNAVIDFDFGKLNASGSVNSGNVIGGDGADTAAVFGQYNAVVDFDFKKMNN